MTSHSTDSTQYEPSMTATRAIDDIELTRHLCNAPKHRFSPVPQPSQTRLDASLNDRALESTNISQSELSEAEHKGRTILYLAYGSNLCDETFRGARGIKPLSQINVLVPELRLTFDLPGLPYIEPCFANTARRDPSQPLPGYAHGNDYHKDRWHKGMVGCVYEVTFKDYAHIIATEGGGASYKDILVTCYPLPEADTVPSAPSTQGFKAHTLFAESSDASQLGYSRPDPSYAQPSARYLKLLTDGATERSLPVEYQKYLHDIRPYTVTKKKQAIGKALFVAIWMPFIALIFWMNKFFGDEGGRSPKWLTVLSGWLFKSMWWNYDSFWKHVCGDGERTMGDSNDNRTPRNSWEWDDGDEKWDEKEPLLI